MSIINIDIDDELTNNPADETTNHPSLHKSLCIAAKNHCKNTLNLILKTAPQATAYLIEPMRLNSNDLSRLPVQYALDSLKCIEEKENESDKDYHKAQQRAAYEFTAFLCKKTLDLLSPNHPMFLEINTQLRDVKYPSFFNAINKENKENNIIENVINNAQNPRILRFTPHATNSSTKLTKSMSDTSLSTTLAKKKVTPKL